MKQLILDSGGLSYLARKRTGSLSIISAFKTKGLWPPVVPTVVLAESLSRRPQTDAVINRLLKICDINEQITKPVAVRAGQLRALAQKGSAVDAIVVALAEPGGAVLTSDLADMQALAVYADNVHIYRS